MITKTFRKENLIKDFCMLLLSCILCSIAVNWVAIPNGFVTTGMVGVALTLQKLLNIDYYLIYYVLTLIILIITYYILGKNEAKRIILLSILFPYTLLVLNNISFGIVIKNKFIAVILFGILYGLGTGFSYSTGYTYGGTDSIAKILNSTLFKKVSVKYILLVVELSIILFMLIAYDIKAMVYSSIGQMVYVYFFNIVIHIRAKLIKNR